jgi:hypothetical protein
LTTGVCPRWVFDILCHANCHKCILHMPRTMRTHKSDNPKTLNPKPYECEKANVTLSDFGSGSKYK